MMCYYLNVHFQSQSVKMVTVNFPLVTLNVTERESKKNKNFPDRF